MAAAQLAAEMEVSVRTVYRDIEALHASGVPLYGDAGPAVLPPAWVLRREPRTVRPKEFSIIPNGQWCYGLGRPKHV